LNLRRAGNSFLGRLRGTNAVYYIQCRMAIILCEISVEDAGDFWSKVSNSTSKDDFTATAL
jgi:hypothetical protein